jgi:uncharacterized protein (TIGR02246 family)
MTTMRTSSNSLRFAGVLALVLGCVLGPALAAAGPVKGKQADEAAIRALVAAQAEAWNRGDAKAWSKDFEPDADFVNIAGMVFSGRKEIEDRHAAVLTSFFRGSRTEVTVRRLLFLTPRLAIVDTDHVVTGYPSLPPTIHAVDGAVRTHMKYVMRKGPKGWMIVAGQNTQVEPLPARPAGAPAAPGKPGQY